MATVKRYRVMGRKDWASAWYHGPVVDARDAFEAIQVAHANGYKASQVKAVELSHPQWFVEPPPERVIRGEGY